MLRSVSLEHYMQHAPVTVLPNTNLFEVANLLVEHKISGLCIVDEQNTLLGVLSEIDCLNAILNATYNESGVGVASEYMTSTVKTAKPRDDIVDIATDMFKNGHRRRPVIDENNKLIGQVTIRQLLKAMQNFS